MADNMCSTLARIGESVVNANANDASNQFRLI